MKEAVCEILYQEGDFEHRHSAYIQARRWFTKDGFRAGDVVIEYGDSQVVKREFVDPQTPDCAIIRHTIKLFDQTVTGESVFEERVEQAERRREALNEQKTPEATEAPATETPKVTENGKPDEQLDPFLKFVLETCVAQKGKNGAAYFGFLRRQPREAILDQLSKWNVNVPQGLNGDIKARIEQLQEDCLTLGATDIEIDRRITRVCPTADLSRLSAEDLAKAEAIMKTMKAELEASVEALNS